jgi:hypothetical protein
MLRNIHPGLRFIIVSGENGNGGQGNHRDWRKKTGETTAEEFHSDILTPLPSWWQDRFANPGLIDEIPLEFIFSAVRRGIFVESKNQTTS